MGWFVSLDTSFLPFRDGLALLRYDVMTSGTVGCILGWVSVHLLFSWVVSFRVHKFPMVGWNSIYMSYVSWIHQFVLLGISS